MENSPSQPLTNTLPATPLTLDGSYILHQMFRVRWSAWKGLGKTEQKHVLANATALFGAMEQSKAEATALFSLLGHKGDLMIVHFRKKLDDLNHAELSLTQCELS